VGLGSWAAEADGCWIDLLGSPNRPDSCPRLSKLDSCFVERGTLLLKRLRRAAVIDLYPWGTAESKLVKQRPDGMKLARHYKSLLDSGKIENRAAHASHLGGSRAGVTQIVRRIQ
jgi:hypothetical protein